MPVPRAVIDSNLVISFLLTRGATLTRLFEHWRARRFVYLLSPSILTELVEVVERPRLRERMTGDPRGVLEEIGRRAEQTAGLQVVAGVCRDPSDDKFLACAREGRADVIVSGDGDLIELGTFDGIPIVTPTRFVALLDVAPDVE